MKREKLLGHELKAIDNLIVRRMNAILSAHGAEDVTPMHGMILGYLHDKRGAEIYQRDIEAEFHITRSTVTSILKLMEKKGYIKRESVACDARLKRITATSLGEDTFHRIDSSIRQTEAAIRSALAPSEYEQLFAMLGKIKSAL